MKKIKNVRQKNWNTKQALLGFVKVTVWAPPEYAERIKLYAALARIRFKSAQRDKAFRAGLLAESRQAASRGEYDLAKSLSDDYINACLLEDLE